MGLAGSHQTRHATRTHKTSSGAKPRSSVAGLIQDFAPSVANLPSGQNDPVKRAADEMLRAANRFVDADPTSVFGSADERLRALFAVVGVAARALSL